jgi:ABC-type sugar transport system permease subunit
MPSGGFYRWQQRSAPYVFVAPFVLTFLCFTLYPMVQSLFLAFFITSGPKSRVFVGFDNFRFLLGDPQFFKAVKNTAIFALCSVFLQLPVSLGLAVLLNSALVRGRNLFRFSFFSPYFLGSVFTAVLFGVIFAPRYGLANAALNALGRALAEVLPVAGPWFLNHVPIDRDWLNTPGLIMPALVLTALWMYAGFNMVYFLAALQAVDKDLLDAAAVDGANAWQRFWHITLPSIKPVAVFVVVLSTIGSFQLFELPFLMLRGSGGPGQEGLTIVMYLYQRGFIAGDLGYASVVGWTLALGVLVISIFQMRLSGTWKPEST